jgi:threonine dehydratase
MNFHNLRYVSERCELGEQKEAILSVTIPEEKGSFKHFCEALGGRVITEFNYRYNGGSSANIFVGIRLTDGAQECAELIENLTKNNYKVDDFSDNELAKLHIRHMVGGKGQAGVNERIFRFQSPEYPGALEEFLKNLGSLFNITLFHYRNHGAAFGQLLAGFEVRDDQQQAFFDHLKVLGYEWTEETSNPAYHSFLESK